MANNSKKGMVGAVLARIIVVILVMILGGIASFFGTKAFFVSRLQKDKKSEIAAELKEESKERVDVAIMKIGDSVSLRIFHNKNQQMVFVPLRGDMELKLDDDGKAVVGEDTSTVAEFIESSTDTELLMKQVETTLSIDIGEYETISDEDFATVMDSVGNVSLNLAEELTVKDAEEQTKTLELGTNDLDGTTITQIINGDDVFTDDGKRAEISADIYVAIGKTMAKKSMSEYEKIVQDYYDKATASQTYNDVKDYMERMHGVKSDSYNYVLLAGSQTDGKFQVDINAATTLFDAILSEEGDVTKAIATTTAAKDDKTDTAASDETKQISIEIQNSTKISGLAGNWKDKLTADGYAVGSILTNRQGELTNTKIIVSREGLGEDLKSYFKNPEYTVGSVASGADICIIIGTADAL